MFILEDALVSQKEFCRHRFINWDLVELDKGITNQLFILAVLVIQVEKFYLDEIRLARELLELGVSLYILIRALNGLQVLFGLSSLLLEEPFLLGHK